LLNCVAKALDDLRWVSKDKRCIERSPSNTSASREAERKSAGEVGGGSGAVGWEGEAKIETGWEKIKSGGNEKNDQLGAIRKIRRSDFWGSTKSQFSGKKERTEKGL